jgi:hypothetical protein
MSWERDINEFLGQARRSNEEPTDRLTYLLQRHIVSEVQMKQSGNGKFQVKFKPARWLPDISAKLRVPFILAAYGIPPDGQRNRKLPEMNAQWLAPNGWRWTFDFDLAPLPVGLTMLSDLLDHLPARVTADFLLTCLDERPIRFRIESREHEFRSSIERDGDVVVQVVTDRDENAMIAIESTLQAIDNNRCTCQNCEAQVVPFRPVVPEQKPS